MSQTEKPSRWTKREDEIFKLHRPKGFDSIVTALAHAGYSRSREACINHWYRTMRTPTPKGASVPCTIEEDIKILRGCWLGMEDAKMGMEASMSNVLKTANEMVGFAKRFLFYAERIQVKLEQASIGEKNAGNNGKAT